MENKQGPSIRNIPQQVDWNKLREKFFSKCTITDSVNGLARVCLASHDLFEWFKTQLTYPVAPPVSSKGVEEAIKVLKECDEYLKEETRNWGKVSHLNNIGAFSTLHQKIIDVLNSQIKETVTDGVDDKFEFIEWIGNECLEYDGKGSWLEPDMEKQLDGNYSIQYKNKKTTADWYTLFQKSKNK